MHELTVTKSIFEIVQKHAAKHKVNKVLSVNLEIGALSDLQNEWIQKYFDYLSKDTIADGAILKIERTPVVMQCDECAHSFEVDIKAMKEIQCPECDNKKCSLVSGREYYIKDMEVM